jgi:small GTP-binding protein
MERIDDFEINVKDNIVVIYDIMRYNLDGLYKYRYRFLYHTDQGTSNRSRSTDANDLDHLKEKLIKIFTYMLGRHGYIYTEEPKRYITSPPFGVPVEYKKPPIIVYPCRSCGSRQIKLSYEKDRLYCLECGYSGDFEEDSIKLQGKPETIYKVIVIGDAECGKTELLTKFATNEFEEKYLPTVGVSILKERITIDKIDKTINVMFWDIAGQPQFYKLHRPYFNSAHGVILAFDLTRSSTFSSINNWWSSCVKYGLGGIPRILVGINKDTNSESERKIILPMAEHLGKKLNAPYFEVSLITGENVRLVFQTIAELMYIKENEKED